MALYYWLGFGRGTIFSFLLFIVLAISLTGAASNVFTVLAGLCGIYIILRVIRWNGTKWGRIHHKGMLVYARLAGWEQGLSQKEGREFNLKQPCSDLAAHFLLNNSENDFTNKIRIVTEYVNLNGQYFADIVNDYRNKIYPNVSNEKMNEILQIWREMPLGPMLIIGKLIETKYGRVEAANYVQAIADGRAK
jgi:hypothetical protein